MSQKFLKLCVNQSDKECCLKVSQTSNTQDCPINHRSRAGLRAVWSIRQSLRDLWWHTPVVIYFAASHSCLSVLSKNKILWNFWHTAKNLTFNIIWAMAWENLSSDVQAGQTRTSRSRLSWHFGNYFWYLVSKQQRHCSECASLLVIECRIQLLSSRHCSFHYQKQPRHFWLHV